MEQLTVIELKALAKEKGIKLPYNASKQTITALLKQKEKMTQTPKSEPVAVPKPEKVAEPPPEKSSKKSSGETRSFQTGKNPTDREDLTEEEAKAKGYYWANIDPKQAGRGGMRTAPPAWEVAK